MAVSDLRPAPYLRTGINIRNTHHINVRAYDSIGKKRLVIGQNNLIPCGIYPFNIHGMSECDPKSLSLAYGIVNDSLMPSENIAVLINKIALPRKRSVVICLYVSGIIIIAYKTYFLGISLVGNGYPCGLCYPPDLLPRGMIVLDSCSCVSL